MIKEVYIISSKDGYWIDETRRAKLLQQLIIISTPVLVMPLLPEDIQSYGKLLSIMQLSSISNEYISDYLLKKAEFKYKIPIKILPSFAISYLLMHTFLAQDKYLGEKVLLSVAMSNIGMLLSDIII